MLCFEKEDHPAKGWFAGPWNSQVPIAVGFANEGINEPHYHAEMYEVYLVVEGRSTIIVEDQTVRLGPGSVLIVEPGELHTFTENTPDYYHVVIHTPVVKGDKHLADGDDDL